MANFKIRWNWVVGGGFIILFVFLLSIHLGLFSKNVSPNIELSSSAIQAFTPKETWMNIKQEGRKIGYSHRIFSKTDKGYKFTESVYMRINSMGVVQGMKFKTEGDLNPDMSLLSFDFSLQSNLFRFVAHGTAKGRQLTIYAGIPGAEKKIELTLKEKPHLGNNILESVWQSKLEPGQSMVFHVFDPAIMGQRPVKVSVLNNERIITKDKVYNAKKVSLDFMGAQQFAWIGEDGDVIKEKGILGITLEQVAKKDALGGFVESGVDITEIASLASNVIIEDPSKLTKLKARLINLTKNLSLDGDRQNLEKNLLTIRKESLPSQIDPSTKYSKEILVFLEPSPFIQSNDPKIQRKVREIISSTDSSVIKAEKLVSWVYKNIEKRPVLSVPNALDTLNNMMGDCNEHAMLLAAMARAAGIPAQIEAGLVYQRGKFYYHAWNSLYLGKWITADAVFGQIPADVTHIRLIRGSLDQQIDLIGSIGKLRLEILSIS